jgi:hypothetical protein
MSEILLIGLDLDQEGEDDQGFESSFVIPLSEKIRRPAPEIRQLCGLSGIREFRKLLEKKAGNFPALCFERALPADLLGDPMFQLGIRHAGDEFLRADEHQFNRNQGVDRHATLQFRQ